MLCPFCGSEDLKVVDKRNVSDMLIRRRRECNGCNKRFTTYERITESELFVIKKSGVKEKFNKEKVKKSLLLSCKKRPVTVEQIDNIVNEVDHLLRKSGDVEFDSEYIGNQVLEKLKSIDDIAYIRFASIFKNFNSINDFREAIQDIKGNK